MKIYFLIVTNIEKYITYATLHLYYIVLLIVEVLLEIGYLCGNIQTVSWSWPTDYCKYRGNIVYNFLNRIRSRISGNDQWIFPDNYTNTCYSILSFLSSRDTNPNVHLSNYPSSHLTTVLSIVHESRTLGSVGTCVQIKRCEVSWRCVL